MAHEKPFSFNTAVDQQRTLQIDNAGLDRFAASGRAVTYALAMVSGGAAPVPVAASNVNAVRYARMNNWVNLWFNINLGTGSTYGGAAWRMAVPGPVAGVTANPRSCRGGWLADQDGTGVNVISGWVQLDNSGGNYINFLYRNTAGVGSISYVGSALPWVWSGASAGVLTGFVTYEIADLFTP